MRRAFLVLVALLAALFTVQMAAAALNTSILTNYPADNDTISGSTFIDKFGNFNLSIGASVTQGVSGIILDAVNMTNGGTSTAYQIYDLSSAPYSAGNNPRSISLWWYPTDETTSAASNAAGLFQAGNAGGAGERWFGGYEWDNNRWRVGVWFNNGYLSDTNVSAGQWYHMVFVYHGNQSTFIYKDGQYLGDIVTASSVLTSDGMWVCGWGNGNGDVDANGKCDEITQWDKALNDSEVSQMYNNRSGCDYDCIQNVTPGPNLTTLTVNLYNNVSLGLIDSVTFSNITGSVEVDYFNITTSGFCAQLNTSGTPVNCSSGSGFGTFFNTTETATVSGSDTINGYTYQATITSYALQLFTGASISIFNITNDAHNQTTNSGTITFPADDGTNNIQVFVAGNYSINYSCTVPAPLTSGYACNVTGIYDALWTINATDALAGGQVLNFSVNMTNATLGSSVNTTTAGEVTLAALQGYAFNFFMDATGYAYSNVTLPTNESSPAYEFSLLPTNSVFLYFYDEETLASILQNVTVEYTNGTVTLNATNATGEMVLQDLTPGSWTLDVSSSGYDSRQYFLTIVSRTSQDIDVYLVNATAGEQTTFTVKDADTGDLLEEATMTMQHKVGTNWVTIDQRETDAFGIAVFDLVDGKQYRFIITHSGYSTKQGTFTRTTNAYVITLNSANTQSFDTYLNDFTYTLSPSDVSPNTTTFSITTSSPEGALEWFSVTVLVNGTSQTSNVTGSPSGGTASTTIDLSPYGGMTVTAVYRAASVNIPAPMVTSRSWYLYDITEGNYTFTGFMEYYGDNDNGLGFASRGIILTIAAVLLAVVVGAFFGFEAAVIMAVIVFLAGGFYSWIHWSISIVVSATLVGMLVLGRGGVR